MERDAELAAIERALARARAEAGGVLLIEAPAGKGKSRLLTVAGDLAREHGMQVMGAHGAELERDFPFGLALQLIEPRLSMADEAERAQLLHGPARRVADLLGGELPAGGAGAEDAAYSVIHGLFWLCANLVAPQSDEDPRPLIMLVDDLHWADRPSLRFLAYIAERIAELPVVLVLAHRSGEVATDRRALAALRRLAGLGILRPGSLSGGGVAELVQAILPDPDAEFCRACAQVTNGNPFLLTELLAQLRRDNAAPDAAMAARLAELSPDAVLNAVAPRVDALAPEARLVARAVAVLGSSAAPAHVAHLTGLELEAVARAGDLLATVHLFHPGAPLCFVHPLIATAVRNSISPHDLAMLHRRTAAILMQEGGPEEQIAVHLLSAPPAVDPAVVEILRSCAHRALVSGAAPTAVRMLRRAVEESGVAEVDPALVAELAEAESVAGLPDALDRLARAIKVTSDPRLRARLALAQCRTHYRHGRYGDAAAALGQALSEVDPAAEIVAELESAYITAAFFVPGLEGEAAAIAQRRLARIGAWPGLPELDLLAHLAIHGGLRGETREAVRDMAKRAWQQGALLQAESLDGLSWPLLSGALLFVGELAFSLEVCDAALAAARELDSPTAYAAASYCRAWPLYEQGLIAMAGAEARAGLDALPDGWRSYLRPAYAAIALCHVQCGALEQAETALSIIDRSDVREPIHVPSLLDARAQLRLAQHRPQEALDDALRAGDELESTLRVTAPGAVAWRSTAALAKLALGDPAGAKALAAAELDEALRIDVPRLILRNLRILGLAERGTAGLDLLAEAVKRGERGSPQLEYVLALLDYGAQLRRTKQRAAARPPLRRALELAHRGGAAVLAERARGELAATGARPRRIMLSGVESLTPSERRVAELAAQGLTTRRIAEALFVTPKTVEFHLRHIYQKLDVRSRGELAQALAPAGD